MQRKGEVMRLFRWCFTVMGLCFPMILQAQVRREEYMDWGDFVAACIDENLVEDGTPDGETSWEQLEEWHAHPMNINRVGRDDLLRLPFLRPEQADSILSYRHRYRSFRTLGELMYVRGLDYEERRRLSLFLYVGDTVQTSIPARRKWWEGKHEVVMRLDVPLYERAGNKSYTTEELLENPNRVYLGNGWANTMRYRYRWQGDVAYGLTLQKDAGEPFGTHNTYPYDYVSAHLHYRSRSRRWEVWGGDYRVRMGQGLLLSDVWVSSHAAMVEQLPRSEMRVRSHTGTNETDYFRGAAMRWSKGSWQLTAFASYRRLDARTEGGTVRSFIDDGLHRTLSECENRRAVGSLVSGAHVSFAKPQWHVGVGAVYSHFSKTICPTPRSYNIYYMRGTGAAGFSLDYAWHHRRWSIQGETALDGDAHFASVHSVGFEAREGVSLVARLRSLSERFVSVWGDVLQDNGRVQNEHGLMLGTKMKLWGGVEVLAYVDGYLHPAPTYRADKASQGWVGGANVRYTLSRKWSMRFRYKLKAERQNVTGYDDLMEFAGTHRWGLQAHYESKSVNATMGADACMATWQTRPSSLGWMLSARVAWQVAEGLRLQGFAAYFHTDDYASRLYAYEPRLRYDAGFPAFAYHGVRSVLAAEWQVCRRFSLGCRYSLWGYFNRAQIASGTQLIDAPTQNDLMLQAHFVF